MQFGAINFPIRPLIDEIRSIAALGFDYIEIAMDSPEASPDMLLMNATEIRKVISHEGLGVMGHMPTFVSLGDLSDRVQRASLEETLRALEASAALGIHKVTLHPGFARGLQRYLKEHTVQRIADSLSKIMGQAVQLDIVVCLENLFPTLGLYVEAEDFGPLLNAFPDARIALDIAHAQINAKRNRSFEFVRRFGNRIAHLHVSDTWGGDDQHLPIGAGMVDYPAILKKLAALGYDQTITLEVFSPDRQYLQASRESIKKMLSYANRRSSE
jgi:sugar phosphate isomerase/epimerase